MEWWYDYRWTLIHQSNISQIGEIALWFVNIWLPGIDDSMNHKPLRLDPVSVESFLQVEGIPLRLVLGPLATIAAAILERRGLLHVRPVLVVGQQARLLHLQLKQQENSYFPVLL